MRMEQGPGRQLCSLNRVKARHLQKFFAISDNRAEVSSIHKMKGDGVCVLSGNPRS